jgi:hypothetical protein
MRVGSAIAVACLAAGIIPGAVACGGTSREAGSAVTAAAPQETKAPSAPEGGAPAMGEGSAGISPLPSHAPALSGGMGEAPSGELAWTVPKEWVEEAPKSGMRKAQYRLPAVSGNKEDGECVVYYFGAGQGGDVKANLDRWASQFRGTSPPKFSEMKAGALTISRAEAKGTYTGSPMSMGGGPEPEPKPDSMLLGAIVPGPDANWFFKCTGPEKTLEANRARFDALLASIHGGH